MIGFRLVRIADNYSVDVLLFPSRPAGERQLGTIGRITLTGRQRHDRGAELHPAVEVDHVLVGEPDAARRDRVADIFRLVGAVDPVQRVLAVGVEVQAARAHWVLRTTRHMRRERAKTLLLTGGWGPARPLGHAADLGDAGPALRLLSYRNTEAEGLAARLDQGGKAIVGISDDRA